MARRLARERPYSSSSEVKHGNIDTDIDVSRRSYLQLGAAAVATVAGIGAGSTGVSATEDVASSFTTDFSEYRS